VKARALRPDALSAWHAHLFAARRVAACNIDVVPDTLARSASGVRKPWIHTTRLTYGTRIGAMRKLPVVPICRSWRDFCYSETDLTPTPNQKHDPRHPASMKEGVLANRHRT
jgi:hypothetical protein